MTQATVVAIPDRYTCRGLTFGPSGQQWGGPVPKGEYDVLGECNLTYSDLGQTKEGKAVVLVNVATGQKYYVGTNVADMLTREYMRQ